MERGCDNEINSEKDKVGVSERDGVGTREIREKKREWEMERELRSPNPHKARKGQEGIK